MASHSKVGSLSGEEPDRNPNSNQLDNMIRKNKLPSVIAAVGAFALFAANTANAIPTLKLSDGITTVTVGDGQIGVVSDLSAQTGAVTFIGAVGSWIVNVSTGISDPILGSPTNPHMDLNSVNVNVSGGSGTDFAMEALIGGTLNLASGSLLTYNTYASATNSLFAETHLLTSQTFNPGAFSGTDAGSFPVTPFPAPYSLTQKVVITHGAAGSTSFNAALQVPDGGTTVALLGFVLLGVEGLRRKLRFA